MLYLYNHEEGVVLVITLLFMLIITTLVFGVLQNSLLESKMANYFSAQDKNLAEAEQQLLKEELKVANNIKTNKAIKISSSEIKNTPYVCGISFYRIKVQNKPSVTLQSTYAVENKADHCEKPPIVQPGRQSWFTGNIIGDL